MKNFELDVLAYLNKKPLKIVQAKGKPISYPVDPNATFDGEDIKQLKFSERVIILDKLAKE